MTVSRRISDDSHSKLSCLMFAASTRGGGKHVEEETADSPRKGRAPPRGGSLPLQSGRRQAGSLDSFIPADGVCELVVTMDTPKRVFNPLPVFFMARKALKQSTGRSNIFRTIFN